MFLFQCLLLKKSIHPQMFEIPPLSLTPFSDVQLLALSQNFLFSQE